LARSVRTGDFGRILIITPVEDLRSIYTVFIPKRLEHVTSLVAPRAASKPGWSLRLR
jgi:hypothetical protein